MTRRRLGTTGDRGNLVRLYLVDTVGVKRYVCQWGPKGARQQDSWPATKEGKVEAEAFFKAFSEETRRARTAKGPMTVRELWVSYLESEAAALRPRTLKLYRDAWQTWEQHIKASTVAEDVTVQEIGAFRKSLDARGLATATVQNCFRNIRIVYNWGERMELIARNRWHLFVLKIAKEKRTQPRAEYRSEEFMAIWRALDPQRVGQWRAWASVGLLGIYGNRQNEILNLRWSWIAGDTVQIPASVVKTGDVGVLTLFPLTQHILAVCKAWADREEYAGDYVLYSGQAEGRAHPSKMPHYSIQSLTDQIHRAEARAAVPTIRWRAGHGFRRGLVGDLVDSTGDVTLALQAIRDKDLRMAPRYRVRRNDKVDAAIQQRAGHLMGAPVAKGATKVQSDPENSKAALVGGSGNSMIYIDL